MHVSIWLNIIIISLTYLNLNVASLMTQTRLNTCSILKMIINVCIKYIILLWNINYYFVMREKTMLCDMWVMTSKFRSGRYLLDFSSSVTVCAVSDCSTVCLVSTKQSSGLNLTWKVCCFSRLYTYFAS